MYFVHIPKTAGITLKAFLEDHYAHGEALVIDEWKARELPEEELRRYRLLSGHYSSEVLDALGERPDMTVMLVREPVDRFRSWMAHCRRLTAAKYRDMCDGRTDREVLDGPQGYTCRQAYWLARAVRDGDGSTHVPDIDELNPLLRRIDIVGVTEELERFMQLVSFRMHWAPPPLGWHINRRPETGHHPSAGTIADEDLRQALAIDVELHDRASARFWGAYTDMLNAIRPDAVSFSQESAKAVPVALAQDWLLHYHEERMAGRGITADSIEIDASDPQEGSGWWWREHPADHSYWWTGPDQAATLVGPPLTTGSDYAFKLEAMGASDFKAWDTVEIDVNGHSVPAVHERFSPTRRDAASLTLTARVPAHVVASQEGLTRISIRVPGTRQALAHIVREDSFDTFSNDTRHVGLAVTRVTMALMNATTRPTLSLRGRTAAATQNRP